MSATLLPTPAQVNDGCYAKNTAPVITITTDETITVKLWIFGDNAPFFIGSYQPDFNGKVTLDIRNLYDDYLNTDIPVSGNSLTQYLAMIYFQLDVIGGASGDIGTYYFFVCNSQYQGSEAFTSWIEKNFLTNQPAEKTTDRDAKEWLSFYDKEGNCHLDAKFYTKGGGSTRFTFFGNNAHNAGLYTVDVSYRKLIAMTYYFPSQLHGYYDVILCDHNDVVLATQRYIYQERTGKEKYFLFVNALGGVDTLICQGANAMQPESTFNIGRFGNRHVPVDDTLNQRRWRQSIGMLPWRQRNWIHEILNSKKAAKQYDPESGNYYDIVVDATDINMADDSQLVTGSFNYLRAEAENIIGQEERDFTLHQSVADNSEPLDDLTVKTVIEFREVQGGGYETDPVAINATHIYVTVGGTATVSVLVNGELEDEIDPTGRMPAVVEIKPRSEVAFSCQEEIDSVTVNYYPVPSSPQASAQEQTES